MDKYRIDSHKLIYHVKRVSDWLDGKIVYPIYMEISPSGVCNHRCTFCGLDFMGYKKVFLDTQRLKNALSELSALGLKSVMYAGEGEPLLHKDIRNIVEHTKSTGTDVSITTNGVLLNGNMSEKILPHLEWIKISLNAGTAETYSKIHNTKEDDFERVMNNLQTAAQIKDQHGYKCILGIQLLLLPENHKEITILAKRARDIGIDYVVVKPYSQHPQSNTDIYKDVKYSEFLHLSRELNEYNTDKFSVIFRVDSMKEWDEGQRNYKKCLSLPFWSYIDSEGNVWGCSVYLGDKRFYCGNINNSTSFKEIWEGRNRAKCLSWVENDLDPASCRVNCRMDKINRYLWELTNPPEHVNFI